MDESIHTDSVLRDVTVEVIERLTRLAEREHTSVSAVAVGELADVSRRADNPTDDRPRRRGRRPTERRSSAEAWARVQRDAPHLIDAEVPQVCAASLPSAACRRPPVSGCPR